MGSPVQIKKRRKDRREVRREGWREGRKEGGNKEEKRQSIWGKCKSTSRAKLIQPLNLKSLGFLFFSLPP